MYSPVLERLLLSIHPSNAKFISKLGSRLELIGLLAMAGEFTFIDLVLAYR